ncbi:hypothetical protein LEP1GSC086_4390 [Leptospira weilii str. LNT 1234]|nr:hypothetical protein LEP1GSC086_4390 [Leptospira weilii str. LNT 1234]
MRVSIFIFRIIVWDLRFDSLFGALVYGRSLFQIDRFVQVLTGGSILFAVRVFSFSKKIRFCSNSFFCRGFLMFFRVIFFLKKFLICARNFL